MYLKPLIGEFLCKCSSSTYSCSSCYIPLLGRNNFDSLKVRTLESEEQLVQNLPKGMFQNILYGCRSRAKQETILGIGIAQCILDSIKLIISKTIVN